jgi:CO/xanthine dehydrogenase Mo-binding subunit
VTAHTSRRAFLTGGGLVVAFALSPGARSFADEHPKIPDSGRRGSKVVRPDLSGDLQRYPLLDSWIQVDAKGAITVFTGKVELGQGIKTALIAVAAEELDVSPAAIALVTADTARTNDEGVTSGSHSMQDSGTAIANAAANVRALLVAAAAARWNVAAEGLTVVDGVVSGGGRHASYGELAGGMNFHVEARADVPRKPPAAHRVIGTTLARVDIPAKLTGGAAYVHDLRLPGMLHARVLRGPSDGTTPRTGDLAAVARTFGVVKVVRNGGFTAIVAEREWTAITALRGLQAAGFDRPGAQIAFDDVHAALKALPSSDEEIFTYPGAPAKADARRMSASFSRPYLLHGSIGPSCAVARLDPGGKLTVWTHSQGIGALKKSIAELLGFDPKQVRCIHMEGAGCYGQNGADDVAADAALCAAALPGRPVRMQWMREQEHGWEPTGPAMSVSIDAAVDGQGRVVEWRHQVWSNEHSSRPASAGGLLAGSEVDPPFKAQKPKVNPMPEGGAMRNGNPIYDLPNASGVFHFIPEQLVRGSALRSLGAHMNVFAIESFMDELARAAGTDPVAYKLSYLRDPRAKDVIETAADRFGWARRAKGGEGRGSGFAFSRYKNLGAYCAIMLELEAPQDEDRLIVHRVVAAVDSGEAVSPDGIYNQIQGSIIQSLSWSTLEALTFDARRRTGYDWASYPILRFDDVPLHIEVHILNRPGKPFLGTGEAAQAPTAAAVANAIADATGIRLRDMPLLPALTARRAARA